MASVEATSAIVLELREEAINEGLFRRGGYRTFLHFAGLVGAWAALVSVGFAADTMWVWIPVWVCVAFLIVGFGGVGHDCAHGTVFKSKFANSLLGHITSAAIGVPFTNYRQYHLLHHADTLGEADPEGLGVVFESRAQYGLFHAALGPGFIGFMWLSSLSGALRRPPKWARTQSSQVVLRRGWFPGVLTFAGVIVASVKSDMVRHIWLFPWLFVLFPVLAFVLCGEHYGGRVEDGTLKNTYTVNSNPITRFAVFNINFHTVHHLLPRVPGPSLHRLNDLAAPYEENKHSGYLAFHRQVLAPLPWFAPRRSATAELATS